MIAWNVRDEVILGAKTTETTETTETLSAPPLQSSVSVYSTITEEMENTDDISNLKILSAIDSVAIEAQRRARTLFNQEQRARIEPPKSAYPFHGAADSLNAALEAVSAISATPLPAFSAESQPTAVYSSVVNAFLSFGEEARLEGIDEGRASALAEVGHRPHASSIAPGVANRLMNQLSVLLEGDLHYKPADYKSTH